MTSEISQGVTAGVPFAPPPPPDIVQPITQAVWSVALAQPIMHTPQGALVANNPMTNAVLSLVEPSCMIVDISH